jgi:glycosyltransferase involved in cell wall biosynthesis
MVSTPLKIVVAGPTGQHGGLEIHTAELVRYLRHKNHHVLHIEIKNIDLNQYSNFSKVQKLIYWIIFFVKARFFRPNLLISTAPGNGYWLLAQFFSSNCFRIIQVVTDDYPKNDVKMSRLLYAHDAAAPQTLILKQQVGNKLSKTIPCRLLPCFHQIQQSILPEPFQPASFENGIRLAYFGRLASNKGLVELIDVWYKLHLSTNNTLDIWGSGPLKNVLTDMLRSSSGVKQTVFINGPYPDGIEYLNLLSSYDGLILPSQATEGLPLVLLEASALGLPILTTSIGGIPDFANNNPDVVMVGIGADSLRSGLERFATLLMLGHFNRKRQQSLFQTLYSRPVIEAEWDLMLKNPRRFFLNSI